MHQQIKRKFQNDISNLSNEQLKNLLENNRHNQSMEAFLIGYEEASSRGLILSDEVENTVGTVKYQNEYYYARGSERVGPMPFIKLLELFEMNHINPKTKVWTQGYADWTDSDKTNLIIDVGLYAQTASTPPPIRQTATYPSSSSTQSSHQPKVDQPVVLKKVNNTFAWLLALTPIVYRLVEYMVSEIFYGETYFFTLLVAIVINSIFFISDINIVRKAGYDKDKLSVWYIALIPLYLFKRAKALDQNNAYAIVWCVLFGITLFL